MQLQYSENAEARVLFLSVIVMLGYNLEYIPMLLLSYRKTIFPDRTPEAVSDNCRACWDTYFLRNEEGAKQSQWNKYLHDQIP